MLKRKKLYQMLLAKMCFQYFLSQNVRQQDSESDLCLKVCLRCVSINTDQWLHQRLHQRWCSNEFSKWFVPKLGCNPKLIWTVGVDADFLCKRTLTCSVFIISRAAHNQKYYARQKYRTYKHVSYFSVVVQKFIYKNRNICNKKTATTIDIRDSFMELLRLNRRC